MRKGTSAHRNPFLNTGHSRNPSPGRVSKSATSNQATKQSAILTAALDGFDDNKLHPLYHPRSPIQTRLKTAQTSSGHHAPIPGTSTAASSSSASIPTSNKFDVLADGMEHEDNNNNGLEVKSRKDPAPAKQKTSRLPPIYIMGLDIPSTISLLAKSGVELNDTSPYLLKLTKTSVQLLAKTKDVFSAVLSALKKNNVDFFTYDVASDVATKIVLQGLPEVVIPDLKEELEKMNIIPRDIKLLHKSSDNDHALYLLYFDKGTAKLQDLRKVKSIFHVVVTWRYFTRRPTDAAQCHRCQRFGHGSRNCNLPPKCVKCGESHFTEKCTLPQKSILGVGNNAEVHKLLVKCVNCSGNHTANYRGCAARKEYLVELEKKKKKKPVYTSSKPAGSSATIPTTQGPTWKPNPPVPSGFRSYSNVTASGGGTQDGSADGDLFTVTEFLALAREMFTRLRGCRNKEQQFLALGELMTKYVYSG